MVTGSSTINSMVTRPASSYYNSDGIAKDPQLCDVQQTHNLGESIYVGCVESDSRVQSIPDSMQGASAKKTSGRGKKHISTPAAESQAKRYKSGIIADGLMVTKNASGRIEPCKQDITCQPHNLALEKTQDAKNGTWSPCNSRSAATSVSIYAATTLMDSELSTPSKTSFDTVRSSQSYGHTLYSGSDGPKSVKSDVRFSQTWLKMTYKGFASVEGLKAGAIETPTASQDDRLHFTLEDQHDRVGSPVCPKKLLKTSSKVANATAPPVQLPARRPSSPRTYATDVRKHPKSQSKKTSTIHIDTDYTVSDDSNDTKMTKLANSTEDMATRSVPALRTRAPEKNIRAVAADYDYDGGLLLEAERRLLAERYSQSERSIGRQPIVRQPFPPPVRDRSPIFGVASHTLLRTCFRVGEALNAGCRAVRTNKPSVLLLELYARVTRSWREGNLQHFVFCDLYHDRPPHVVGTYELWDQSRLWELDSRAFLAAGEGSKSVMCRAMARMRRDGAGWRLEVMGIWEAGWDDVDFVAGIYQKADGANLSGSKVSH